MIYRSLEDLPFWNWWHLKRTHDLSFLKKDKTKKVAKKELEETYLKLEQEYLDRFGSGDGGVELLELLKRKIIHQCSYLLGKKHVINYIKAIDFQLEALYKSAENSKPQSIEEISAILSKYMGFNIDPKRESVIDFKVKLNLLEQENNKILQHGSKTDTK